MTRKHYEILFILKPMQEGQLDKVIENYRSMVTHDGDIHRFENCGLRQFAYMIENIRRGYYILMNIECSIETVQKIEKSLRTDESVLRFLLMATKNKVSGTSPLSKNTQELAISQRNEKEAKKNAAEATRPEAMVDEADEEKQSASPNDEPGQTEAEEAEEEKPTDAAEDEAKGGEEDKEEDKE